MRSESLGFSTAEALLYLCATRCGLGRLSRTLVGVTVAGGLIVALAHLLGS